MRIGIPLADGRLCPHFGHCEAFALIDVDPETRTVRSRQDVASPPHQPGLLPAWLAQQGATVVIAGGMGQRAQMLFTEQGIQVVIGAPAQEPGALVAAWLAGTLAVGDNLCDH